jgi:pantetheine-phosphate adenylyltransferase
MEMLTEICKPFSNVTVSTFSGLAVDYAVKNKVTVIVRGLRTEADFVYEMQMAMMNRTLDSQLETIFIPTRQDLSHVSSTLVREVATLGGNVSNLVPPVVFEALRQKSLSSNGAN